MDEVRASYGGESLDRVVSSVVGRNGKEQLFEVARVEESA